MRKKLELVGQRFGRWLVIKEAARRRGIKYWECLCDCGNIRIVCGGSLTSGHTKSCGCFKKDVCTKHGMSRTPEYGAWYAMLRRCNNKNVNTYCYYGGRGISVCKEWEDSFMMFYKEMGPRPEGLTLERIDTNKGYYKENCKWDTEIAQKRNRRLFPKNKTGMPGVNWDKDVKKYRAQIGLKGKCYFLGFYALLDDAKKVRQEAEQKYWKQK